MSRNFQQATAELVVQVSEAVASNEGCNIDFIVQFCDIPRAQAENAISMAADLGLIIEDSLKYSCCSPITRFLCTPADSQKAAVIRLILESYEPFLCFRERLIATGSVDTAAHNVKVRLDLSAHKEEIKDALISLGTYSKALSTEGGGQYRHSQSDFSNQLREIAESCDDLAAAEACIRTEIGDYSDVLNRSEVILPLAQALLKARDRKPTEAVTEAALAIESYLARLASRLAVDITGAAGLIQRVEKFRTDGKLPKKIIESAKYLGQVRNAADHGVDADPEVDSVWQILDGTGLQYVFVCCSFIRACGHRENGNSFCI